MVEKSDTALVALAAAPLLLLPAALLLLGSPQGPALTTLALALLAIVPGLHLIAGIGGMPFLAHATLAGIGGMAAGEIAAFEWSMPVPALLAAGAVVAGIVGTLLGALLTRLPPLALAGASLALAELATVGLGLADPEPAFVVGGLDLPLHLGGMLAALVALGLGARIGDSLHGRALHFAADSPGHAAASGLDLVRERMRLLVIGAMLAGAGGALLVLAPDSRILQDSFGTRGSILMLAVVLIGGVGSLPGALIAAFAVMLLPELARSLVPGLPDLRPVVAAIGVALTLALRVENDVVRLFAPRSSATVTGPRA